MRIFKKEKKVVNLVKQHVKAVETCVRTAQLAVEHYVRGDLEEAETLARQANEAESEADGFRHEIREMLFSGAYLPMIREDIHHLIEGVDKVANGAEDCADFFLGQRPEIPEEMRESFTEITAVSFSIVKPLARALEVFFKPKGKIEELRERAAEVVDQESVVDKREWKLTRKIFGSDLELGHKLHLRRALDRIVEVPDRAEDAVDRLELARLKSVI